jgi:cysteine desulfurase
LVNHTYLDYGASSPVGEDVINTMVDVAKNCYGNPSSKHNDGVEAHDIIAHARKTIMDYIGGNEGDDLIFTSGATESNSIAIQGFCRAYNKVRIFYTPLEHEDII